MGRSTGPFNFSSASLPAALLLLIIFWLPILASRAPKPVPTRNGRNASIEGIIFLRVPLGRRHSLRKAALRYTGSTANLRKLKRFNHRSHRHPLLEARIPIGLLLPRYRDEALRALFPKDRRTANGWEHVWGSSPLGRRESWADIARWFAGASKYGNSVAASNTGVGRHPGPGARVLIPAGLLIPAIRAIKAPPPPPGPGLPAPSRAGAGKIRTGASNPAKNRTGVKAAATTTAGGVTKAGNSRSIPPHLVYGRDAKGKYAIYRLKAGEALYSAVVVRFTGNVRAADVNALAAEIAKRSEIKDVTSIAVGFPVKIPLDNLLPQFLPKTNKRYKAWAKNREELRGVKNTYKSAALQGVVVILDPGHGGLDRGAVCNGVWEDSYVYDIACRIYEGLERRTKARVLMTLLVPRLGYHPQNKRKLLPNFGAVVLTHPWFHLRSKDEIKMEVNLRWYLANQYYLHLRKMGVSAQRVVFTSIHADSLHPSLRGTMFYVPGDAYRAHRWCASGRGYSRYAEYNRRHCYHLSTRALRHNEGLSLQFSRQLEKAFRAGKLLLHPYNPTRDHVVRRRKPWVPAVLRNTIVPCAVLIEVCNLNNREDAARIADPAFRQRVADAYIDALIKYYS